MSDERWSDNANGSDPEHPYIYRVPRPGVRPAAQQPDRRGPPTPEEIATFIAKEFGDGKSQEKNKLRRPPGWDGSPQPIEPVVDEDSTATSRELAKAHPWESDENEP